MTKEDTVKKIGACQIALFPTAINGLQEIIVKEGY